MNRHNVHMLDVNLQQYRAVARDTSTVLLKIYLADVSQSKKSNLLYLQDVVFFVCGAFCLISLEIGDGEEI